jgi:serine/threonine-protein kinase
LAADTEAQPGDSRPTEINTDLGADTLPAPAAELAVADSPTTLHIGRYALKGLLGRGSLGQVHEAWDPLLSRTVAVKTLQLGVGTPARLALDTMFLNEAHAAAALSHPHIVAVYDAGLSAQGVYIAMERLRGSDLRQRLAEGWRPTQAQAALLMRRVADALAYAHGCGVVHGDIKPANIFLNRRDQPKVLDFGIARAAQGAQHFAVQPTPEPAVAAAPNYLAPEQLQGGAVDARTDIHAWGVVFYELLAQRKAYTGDSPGQIAHAVVHNNPAPACEVREGVSRTLSAMAAKAMARDPLQRYATALEMAHELRRWIERHNAAEPQVLESSRPRKQAPGERQRRRANQTLRTWLGVSVLVLLVCAGVTLALWGRLQRIA